MSTLFLGNFPAFMGHFGYGWHMGPHPGSGSPFLIFFGLLFLFAMLGRGRRRWNSPRGGGYNRGPRGPYGPPYSRGPWQGDMQDGHGSGQQGYNPPQANQYNPPQAGPYYGYGNPGNYGETAAPGNQGTPTVRVDPNPQSLSGQGAPTVRVDSGANYPAGTPTVRVDQPAPSSSGGQLTQPLGPAPSFPSDNEESARGRVEPEDIGQNNNTQS